MRSDLIFETFRTEWQLPESARESETRGQQARLCREYFLNEERINYGVALTNPFAGV